MKKLFTRIILHFSNPIKALKLDIVYFYSLYSKLMLKVIYKIKIPINDSFYKIDYSDLYHLFKIVIKYDPKNCIEIGGGYSSIVIAQALELNFKKYNIKVNLTILEQKKQYVHLIKKYLKKNLSYNCYSFINIKKIDLYIDTIYGEKVSLCTDLPDEKFDFFYEDRTDHLDTRIAGDALKIEKNMSKNFIICVDGMGSTVRFYMKNLTRKYKYLGIDFFSEKKNFITWPVLHGSTWIPIDHKKH